MTWSINKFYYTPTWRRPGRSNVSRQHHCDLPQPSRLWTMGFLPPRVIIHVTSSSLSLTSWCSAYAGMRAKSPGASSWRLEPFGPLTMAPWPLAAYTIVSGTYQERVRGTCRARQGSGRTLFTVVVHSGGAMGLCYHYCEVSARVLAIEGGTDLCRISARICRLLLASVSCRLFEVHQAP